MERSASRPARRRPPGRRRALLAPLACALALAAITGCSRESGEAAPKAGLAPVALPVITSAERLRRHALSLGDRLTSAYRRGSWAGVDSLLADDYLGCAPDVRWDRAALRREFPRIRMRSFHRDSAIVKALGAGVVLLDEDVTLGETYAGRDISGRYRMTTVWAFREARWRLVFEQEIPLDPAAKR